MIRSLKTYDCFQDGRTDLLVRPGKRRLYDHFHLVFFQAFPHTPLGSLPRPYRRFKLFFVRKGADDLHIVRKDVRRPAETEHAFSGKLLRCIQEDIQRFVTPVFSIQGRQFHEAVPKTRIRSFRIFFFFTKQGGQIRVQLFKEIHRGACPRRRPAGKGKHIAPFPPQVCRHTAQDRALAASGYSLQEEERRLLIPDAGFIITQKTVHRDTLRRLFFQKPPGLPDTLLLIALLPGCFPFLFKKRFQIGRYLFTEVL